MNFTERALWIIEQAYHFSPFALALILAIAYSIWKEHKTINLKQLPLLMIPLLPVLFIILSGSYFKQQPDFSDLPTLGLCATLISSILVTLKCKGWRLLAGSTTALILWYGFWTSFVAGMMIVDEWV